MSNDDYCYYRLTSETQTYLDEYGAQPVSDHMPQYCLRVPQAEVPHSGDRPLVVHRCPWKDYRPIEGGPRIQYDLLCVTGDAVSKLAEYENIHIDPRWLKEMHDEYTELMKATCYECDLYCTKDCKWHPKLGSNVRINCPFFRHQLSIEEGDLAD